MHKAGLTADRQDHREVAQRASARRAGGLMFLFFSFSLFNFLFLLFFHTFITFILISYLTIFSVIECKVIYDPKVVLQIYCEKDYL